MNGVNVDFLPDPEMKFLRRLPLHPLPSTYFPQKIIGCNESFRNREHSVAVVAATPTNILPLQKTARFSCPRTHGFLAVIFLPNHHILLIAKSRGAGRKVFCFSKIRTR